MHFIVQFMEFVASVGLIVVTCLQVTKAETGGAGAMGLGNLGGRASNTPVGQERILKPLTMWCGVTFIVMSILLAVPSDLFQRVAVVGVPLFVLGMWFRAQLGERIGRLIGLSED